MAEEQETELVPEEELTSVPGWAPTVNLEVQDVRTGEEDEEEIYSQRSKLYRFSDGEWKERGVGDSKLLRHKVSGKVRYMMRQERTGKIVANHYVFEHELYCNLKDHMGSDKTWMWTALDYAEDEMKNEKFALRFKDQEIAARFQSAFDGAKVSVAPDNVQADGPSQPVERSTQPADPEPAEAAAGAEENDLMPEEEVTVVPGWAPTVTLEPQDTRTGEEDEDEIYSQRSKLYRFKDGEWKERGLGDSKLLKHRESGKIRYMMRQERTGKIVANHYVVAHPPYCELATNAGNEKIWTWTAFDYSEDEQHVEQFSLRFKDEELAQQFKVAFNNARAEMAKFPCTVGTPENKTDAPVVETPAPVATPPSPGPQSETKDNGNPFAGVSLFAPSLSQSSGTAMTGATSSGGLFSSLSSTGGADSSGGLFSATTTSTATSGGFGSSSIASTSSGLFSGGMFASTNTGGGLYSGMSFGTNKADSPKEAEDKSSSEATAPFANLTFASSTGGLFGSTSGGLFSGNGGLFGNSGNSTSSSGLFSGSGSAGGGGGLFAGLPESSSGGIFNSTANTASTGSSLFGSPASAGGLFGAAAGGSPASSGGLFSAASGGILGGTANAAAPSPGLWAGATANGAQDDDQYVLEEEVTQIPGWAPSVSLEVKEYVETGEEDEQEMYSQRSKLLRFVENEWKERGTGDAKILRHTGNNKCRFLMRQDKTSKIVANHYIINQKPYCELVHNANNAKIWVWTALDWADEEQKVEKFALRFKTEELAEKFEEAFNSAKSGEWPDADAQEDDDWEKAEAYGSADGQGSLTALATAQATAGWRCDGCRLTWDEEAVECGVCEIARPGFEAEATAAQANKDSGKQSAVAAFLGTSQPGAGGSFAQSASSSTTFGLGFGTTATSSASAASPGPSIFGTNTNANPSTGSIFGNASASSLFGAPANTSSATGANNSVPSAFTGFGNTADHSSSATTVKAQPALPPPPPAVPSAAAQDPAGCGQGVYAGYPCGQHFPPLAQMQSCMAQMGMAGMMGGPGMCGFGGTAPVSAESSRVEVLERSVKEMQDKLKDMRDTLEAERQGRGQVELRLQFVDKRLQEEESRRTTAEARVAAAESQARQAEIMVEGLRRSLDRMQPAEDTRLISSFQKNLEEQLAPLRKGLEQKTTEEMRLLNKVLEVQGRDADTSVAMKQRLEALEARLDRMGVEMPVMTVRPPPDRVAFFQSLQAQQTGRRLANGCEDEPRSSNLQLIDPKPLLRRIP